MPSANGKSATVGFCWGGTTSFMYATVQPALNAAVVYYGTGPDAMKVARGGATIPLYRQKLVWHAEEMRSGHLESAQIIYPDCTLWDAMDTQGYIPEIMERYEVYLDTVQTRAMEMNSELDHEYEAAGEYFASGEWCT